MRILDETSDLSLSSVTLYFTLSEASELRDALDDLLAKPIANHVHISQEDYQKEVTVCIYDADNLEADDFSPRSLRLIKEGN